MKLIREEINMDISDVKPFTEMTSRELFVILTGGQGVMQQMYLQNILKEYLMKYGDTADLVTMVRKVADQESGDSGLTVVCKNDTES